VAANSGGGGGGGVALQERRKRAKAGAYLFMVGSLRVIELDGRAEDLRTHPLGSRSVKPRGLPVARLEGADVRVVPPGDLREGRVGVDLRRGLLERPVAQMKDILPPR
jgi:hypothetical protein